MSSHRYFRSCCALSVIVLAVVFAGCFPFWEIWQQPVSPSGGDAVLVPFNSPTDLLSYFKQQASERYRNRSADVGFFDLFLMGPMAATEGGVADDQSTGGSGDSEPYTTTNIQEAGVDESDVIKSDGTYFYIASGQSLRIVQATPADQMAEVGRLDLDTAIDSMYLLDSKLIILGQVYGEYAPGDAEVLIWPPYYRSAGLMLYEVDVSDRANPTVTKQMELDGSLVSSRLTNGRLIVVLTIVPDLPADPTPVSIGTMTLDEVMPQACSAGAAREMVAWEDWLYPTVPDGYYMTAVVTLDANDVESILGSVAILANAGTVYASPEALYVTDADYDPSDDYREKTAIHKFAYDEQGVARYVASGSVPGRPLNQFSLGEYEDHLRIATHVETFGWLGGDVAVGISTATVGVDEQTAQSLEPSGPYNAVYVLAEDGADLNVVGQVENIAPNETLHSARFLGDYGFLVTYRKIDPLFILNLADPADPQIIGELKVPGFSDYLHPLDDTHLIGVGKYTSPTDEGFDWFQGVQISLFDVSDWSNPTAVQQITLGGRGSYSEVDYTHKAFTFLPEENLLAIPMHLYTIEEPPWQYGELTFDGVVTFRVDAASGFTELGRLEMVRDGDYQGEYRYYGSNDWARAAFIGQTVYALSPDGVRAAPTADFSTTSAVTLP